MGDSPALATPGDGLPLSDESKRDRRKSSSGSEELDLAGSDDPEARRSALARVFKKSKKADKKAREEDALREAKDRVKCELKYEAERRRLDLELKSAIDEAEISGEWECISVKVKHKEAVTKEWTRSWSFDKQRLVLKEDRDAFHFPVHSVVFKPVRPWRRLFN